MIFSASFLDSLDREVLFWILLISVLFFVLEAVKDTKKIYEFPFLFSIATLVYIIPTLYSMKDSIFIKDIIVTRYIFNSLLCFWLGIIGFAWGMTFSNPKLREAPKFDFRNMKIVLSIYVLVGAIASSFIDPTKFGGETGGMFAIILFFSRFLRPTAIILFSLYLLKPSKYIAFLILIWLAFSLQFILISGRRSETIITGMVFIFPLFFLKGVKLSRSLLLPVTLLALIVLIVFPVYRQFTRAGDYSQLANISLTEVLSSHSTGERTNEVVEAAYNMHAVENIGAYNYGASFINGIIGQFVSSTIFGKDVKQSLAIETTDLKEIRAASYQGYDDGGFRFYLAPTGFGNAFLEFGYFGSLMYLLFGLLSAVLLKRAVILHSLDSKVFYCMFAIMILFSVYDSIPAIVVFFLPYIIVFIHSVRFSKIR